MIVDCKTARLEIDPMARMLVIPGLVPVAAGLLGPLAHKVGIGRLPGDFIIEREGFRVYFPLSSAFLISALLSLVFWFFGR
jgi:hypothetical protein